jgi:hypothetical protein
MVSIVVALAAATTNLRLLRRGHEEKGEGDAIHPHLQPDRPHHGFAELTKERANKLMQEHPDIRGVA